MLAFFSKYLENAVNEIAKLPGIGKRTALRLTLHLVKADKLEVAALTSSINNLKEHLCYCKNCFNLSDKELCEICENPKRDHSVICVVQDIRDVIAIENTNQYSGVYHVLGGVISPMDGIGINQLRLQELFARIEQGGVREVVLALPATVEGDTTNFFIYKNIKDQVAEITTIARGVGIGEELEYADEVTLGRSLMGRTRFESVLSGTFFRSAEKFAYPDLFGHDYDAAHRVYQCGLSRKVDGQVAASSFCTDTDGGVVGTDTGLHRWLRHCVAVYPQPAVLWRTGGRYDSHFWRRGLCAHGL